MNVEVARRGLARTLRRLRYRPLALGCVGFAGADVAALRTLADQLAERLAIDLRLVARGGDVVLLDLATAVRASPQQLHDMTAGRPVVVVGSGGLRAAGARRDAQRDDVLQQLQSLPVVRERSALWHSVTGWDATTGFQNGPAVDASIPPPDPGPIVPEGAAQRLAAELDSQRADVIATVLRGLGDATTPQLAVSYGPGAGMWFDFQSRLVISETRVRQYLRIGGALPLPAPEATPRGDIVSRDLDRVVWDLGQCAGNLALLDAPADWWNAPLRAVAAGDLTRYTRQPLHLELARLLTLAPTSPRELRRRGRIGVPELRGFLQACLMLGLVRWDGGSRSRDRDERVA